MPKHWNVYVDKCTLHRVRPRKWLPKGLSIFYLNTGRYTFELTAKSRRGICVTARWARGDRLRGQASEQCRWEYPSMAIRKREVRDNAVQHLAAVETRVFAEHLALVEHCCLRKYEDGSDRDVGWFTIKTTGAAWVVQVKDPDSCCSFQVVADTLDKAFDSANLLLACDDAPWEHDTWLAKAKMEKKKK